MKPWLTRLATSLYFLATVSLVHAEDVTLQVTIGPKKATDDGAKWVWKSGSKTSNPLTSGAVAILDVPAGETVVIEGLKIKGSPCNPPAPRPKKVHAGPTPNQEHLQYSGSNCK